jgi:hypothetical protein
MRFHFPLFWKRWFEARAWRKEWQDGLSQTLHTAQKDLNLNMVVVVARESDLYAEILYTVSFVGFVLGLAGAIAWKFFAPEVGAELLLLPVLGFTAGSLAHTSRERLLRTAFHRLAEEKAQLKAKAYFFEHSQQLKGRLVLLYLSETEHIAQFLGSQSIVSVLPYADVFALLKKLERDYTRSQPLASLKPCIEDLGDLLRKHFQEPDNETVKHFAPPLFVGATDRDIRVVPILKGSKDIN